MLKLEHVKKTFNKGSANEVILYRDLNVEIHDGEFVTIIGSNGSGKSTFFNVISGNIRQDAGSVSFNGKDVSRLERELADMQLGLENKLHVSVGSLSGGQRQALSLLMATLITPQLLLLDEHTAALDPKTSDLIIQLTKKIVEEKKMTTIMITHNLKHAITYGDRLLMFHKGEIIMDIPKEEKKQLTVEKLIEKFNSLNMLDALDDELAFSAQ